MCLRTSALGRVSNETLKKAVDARRRTIAKRVLRDDSK